MDVSPLHSPLIPSIGRTVIRNIMSLIFERTGKGTTKDGRSFEAFCAVSESNGREYASVARWIDAMLSSTDSASLDRFLVVLRESKYDAFFFEVKPVDKSTAEKSTLADRFEFALVDAADLHKAAMRKGPDASRFEEKFDRTSNRGSVFANIGGDAMLITPNPPGRAHTDVLRYFSHLASFCRFAPRSVVSNAWQLAVEEYKKQIEESGGNGRIYLSTDGRGVLWVHFRVEKQPKYHKYYS